jgi:hypothetical protein
MVQNDRSELRWGVEQRLEFIEFRLFWEGWSCAAYVFHPG